MISISIYRDTNGDPASYVCSDYADNIHRAMQKTGKIAAKLIEDGTYSKLCLRDCLGGLRAEVWRDDEGKAKFRITG